MDFIAMTVVKGTGTMPDTHVALKTAVGSIHDLGMDGESTYYATQAGWGILWTVLALLGVGGFYTAAQQAGIIH